MWQSSVLTLLLLHSLTNIATAILWQCGSCCRVGFNPLLQIEVNEGEWLYKLSGHRRALEQSMEMMRNQMYQRYMLPEKIGLLEQSMLSHHLRMMDIHPVYELKAKQSLQANFYKLKSVGSSLLSWKKRKDLDMDELIRLENTLQEKELKLANNVLLRLFSCSNEITDTRKKIMELQYKLLQKPLELHKQYQRALENRIKILKERLDTIAFMMNVDSHNLQLKQKYIGILIEKKEIDEVQSRSDKFHMISRQLQVRIQILDDVLQELKLKKKEELGGENEDTVAYFNTYSKYWYTKLGNDSESLIKEQKCLLEKELALAEPYNKSEEAIKLDWLKQLEGRWYPQRIAEFNDTKLMQGLTHYSDSYSYDRLMIPSMDGDIMLKSEYVVPMMRYNLWNQQILPRGVTPVLQPIAILEGEWRIIGTCTTNSDPNMKPDGMWFNKIIIETAEKKPSSHSLEDAMAVIERFEMPNRGTFMKIYQD